jgi:glutamate dehydrogenase
VFDMRRFWTDVEALDNVVPAETQFTMLLEGRKLVERATRWLVRHRAAPIDIAAAVSSFAAGAEALAEGLPETLDGEDREVWDTMFAELGAAGVPGTLAARVAGMAALLSALDVVEVADSTGRPLDAVSAIYFRLATRLQLHWLRDRILEQPRADRWQTLARAALRDDIQGLQRELTSDVLQGATPADDVEAVIDAWVERNAAAVERYLEMLAEIKATRQYDLTTLPLALREVRNLIGAAVPPG